MKNQFKISIAAIAFTSLFTFGAKAQQTDKDPIKQPLFRLSVGPQAALPISNLHNSYDWGFGGSVQGDLNVISNKLAVTLNVGYLNFFSKDLPNIQGQDLSLIPVKAGLKYFPVGNLYLQGEAGASFITDKNKVAASRSALFLYSPQIGYQFNLGKSDLLDAGLRFESNAGLQQNADHNNFFGFRVAYSLGL